MYLLKSNILVVQFWSFINIAVVDIPTTIDDVCIIYNISKYL